MLFSFTCGLELDGLHFRYTLPIGAVDTHRPKPKGQVPTVQITTARQYYADGTADPIAQSAP